MPILQLFTHNGSLLLGLALVIFVLWLTHDGLARLVAVVVAVRTDDKSKRAAAHKVLDQTKHTRRAYPITVRLWSARRPPGETGS